MVRRRFRHRLVQRADLVVPSLDTAEALTNAPDATAPFFRVPRVIG